MEPLSRGGLIKAYEASRAKVYVYMAEALINHLGDETDIEEMLRERWTR